MPKVELQFAGGAYNMPATQLDAQTCVNWYTVIDQLGKYKTSLHPRPGLKVFIDDSSHDIVRGQLVLNDVLYVVIDDEFYACYEDLTKELLGTLETSTGNVKIINNDYQILITDGVNGYVYQLIETDIYDEGVFFKIQNASSVIDDPVFHGTGIDDLTVHGKYIGDLSRVYRVKIDSVGATDTFTWSEDDGVTWQASNVAITMLKQKLSNGVSVSFNSKTGHTLGDYWSIVVTVESAFYTPIYPCVQDGYGIYPMPNSNRFYITAINDFNSVDPLDYAAANVYADYIVGAVSMDQEVYIIKTQSIEIFNNVGAATEITFPFQRRSNFVINYGCEAAYSIQVGSFNIIFMLGRNKNGARVVIKIENYSASIISTEPLNMELRTYEIVSDAYGDIVEINGHIFYYLTFPSVDKTWVYDLTTGLWSEWKSIAYNEFPSAVEKREGMFRGRFNSVFFGKNIIGDSRSGKLFIFDRETIKDDVEQIIFERIPPHFSSDDKFVSINYLRVDMEAGVADQVGQGSHPQIMLQISRDGGKTWGSEMWRSSGYVGKYKTRSLWARLGTARQFTYKIRCSDPVYNVLLGAVADIEVFE